MPLIAVGPPRVEPKPLWVERTLVFRKRAGDVVALDGWVYGPLAIHATWDDRMAPPVTVTHWPSRLAVARVATAEQAVELAEWLFPQCPRLWMAEEITLAGLPPAVADKLKALHADAQPKRI